MEPLRVELAFSLQQRFALSHCFAHGDGTSDNSTVWFADSNGECFDLDYPECVNDALPASVTLVEQLSAFLSFKLRDVLGQSDRKRHGLDTCD
jgi:hypothetical protein